MKASVKIKEEGCEVNSSNKCLTKTSDAKKKFEVFFSLNSFYCESL